MDYMLIKGYFLVIEKWATEMQFDILDVKVIRLIEDLAYENTDCMFHIQNFTKMQTLMEE